MDPSPLDTSSLELTQGELEPKLDAAGRDYTLIDVRERFELGRGILPGATNLPMSELQARVGEIDRDRDVVVYCEHGVRSFDVAAWLASQGWKARSLEGGFSAWTGPRADFAG